MTDSMPEIPALDLEALKSAVPPGPQYRFAAVIDGVVVRTFSVDADAAVVFGNSPTFIQVSPATEIRTGLLWDGENFINPRN
jgi:hypothetical protein